jgi:hypothetical protein
MKKLFSKSLLKIVMMMTLALGLSALSIDQAAAKTSNQEIALPITHTLDAATKTASRKVKIAHKAMQMAKYKKYTIKNGVKFYTYFKAENVSDIENSETYKAVQSVSTTSSRLTKSAGAITGPNGKETYYNLNMNGVVRIMRNHGNTDKYWVRSDGVKMLGNYVMVAADQARRPLGSIYETSLGLGIVCDTGSFVSSNHNQTDIATNW